MTIVSITFDDGLRCQFEKALPILDHYGLPATFFLTANTSAIHVDWCSHADWPKIEWNPSDIELLKTVAQRRHEIGSHSVWHKFPDPSHPIFRPDFDPTFEAAESKRLSKTGSAWKSPLSATRFAENLILSRTL